MAPSIHRLGGSGAPAVLVHGFGADRLSWLANQHELAKVAEVHGLDLPGHGDEALHGDGTVGGLADALSASLDAAGLDRVHLVGHSLGGAVASTVAARRPDRVRSLTLIAPAGLGGPVDLDFLDRFPEADDPAVMEPLLHRLVSRPRLINRHMVARAIDQLRKPGSRDALRRIAAGLKAAEAEMADVWPAVAAADLPRLVVWGDADAINPPDTHRLALFGGETLLVEGAAHMPHVEAMKPVNEAMADFIARTG